MNLSEFIRCLPKCDLHVHLDGSLRESTFYELADSCGHSVAESPFKESYCSLNDYLATFAHTCAVLGTADAIRRVSYELCVDAFSEGVYYQEIRFAPQLLESHTLTAIDAIAAVADGVGDAEKKFNLDSQQPGLYRAAIIVCAMRSPESLSSRSIDAAHLAIEARDKFAYPVVGFDLAGAEKNNSAKAHAAAFSVAADAGLGITVHAGEDDGPHSIADAINSCHAQRIGHGVALVDDLKLATAIVESNITLEVCLTSNFQTMPQLQARESHPLGRLLEMGVPVSLATDNRLVSSTTLSAEYGLAADLFSLNQEQLHKISMQGFGAMFYPGSLSEANKYLAAITSVADTSLS
ncbi:MAG: adenosine deaminase [Planctomycetota bacterium]|jgi:adenosine deaminase|nr:adenosine deaminase [Planctomycetota bacterium]